MRRHQGKTTPGPLQGCYANKKQINNSLPQISHLNQKLGENSVKQTGLGLNDIGGVEPDDIGAKRASWIERRESGAIERKLREIGFWHGFPARSAGFEVGDLHLIRRDRHPVDASEEGRWPEARPGEFGGDGDLGARIRPE